MNQALIIEIEGKIHATVRDIQRSLDRQISGKPLERLRNRARRFQKQLGRLRRAQQLEDARPDIKIP